MRKPDHFKFWIGITAFIIIFEAVFYVFVYYYRPPWFQPQAFNFVQLASYFIITLPLSLVSRLYGNWRSEEEELNVKGFINSVRDSIHGWYFFYLLVPLLFIVWDYLFFGKFPWELFIFNV